MQYESLKGLFKEDIKYIYFCNYAPIKTLSAQANTKGGIWGNCLLEENETV